MRSGGGRKAEQGEQRQGGDAALPPIPRALASADRSRCPSSTRWRWHDGWEKDEPRELQERVCVSDKPLAAHCVVPAIACKAPSVREESRVKCSPGPRDRCSPPPASIPALPAPEAQPEQRKAPGSSSPAGRQGRLPPGKGCAHGHSPGSPVAVIQSSPKTNCPRTVGFRGRTRSVLWRLTRWSQCISAALWCPGSHPVAAPFISAGWLIPVVCQRSFLLRHATSPWSTGRRAWKPLRPGQRGSTGEARRAGVCDPPTLTVPLPFLKRHPRSHTTCGG